MEYKVVEKYKVVESREIVWCEYDDRYVLIVKEDNDIVGLNFMQGDELDLFKKSYSNIDTKLTDYYNAVAPYLGGLSEIDRINQAMWAYHTYNELQSDRKYEKR